MGGYCYQSSFGHRLARLENAIKVLGRARERKDVDLNAINIGSCSTAGSHTYARRTAKLGLAGHKDWKGRYCDFLNDLTYLDIFASEEISRQL